MCIGNIYMTCRTELTLQLQIKSSLFCFQVLRKLELLKDDYVQYLTHVKLMCQGIWAKFDTSSMLLGFTTVLTAFLMVIFVLTMSHGGHHPIRYSSLFIQ